MKKFRLILAITVVMMMLLQSVAFAAMPNGTVVIGDKAYSLAYVQDAANADAISAAIVAAGANVFVKGFGGSWTTVTGGAVLATAIPAVTYISDAGDTTLYNAGDVNTAFALTSVTSSANYKEVVVNYNMAGDEELIGEKTNYTVKVNDVPNSVELATVSDDGKSVVLTLQTAATPQADIEVTVSDDTGIEDDVTMTVEGVTDFAIPVAQTLKQTGPNTMTVTFSEPVAAVPTVLVANGAYAATLVLSANKRVMTITTTITLPAGTYSVKVGGVADYAGFTSLSKTFDWVNTKDTTAPTVVSITPGQKTVKVKFSRPVFLATTDGSVPNTNLIAAYFYHSYSSWNPDSVSRDGATYTLTFSSRVLPVGSVAFTVKSANGDPAVAVVDAWGNALASSVTQTISVTADTTAPTITKVAQGNDEKTIKLTFSEALDLATAQITANYKILKADGVTATNSVTNASYSDKVVTLTLGSKLAGGNYNVNVKNLIDLAPVSPNKMATVTLPFSITDKTAPHLNAATYVDGSSSDIIYLTFSEAMAASAYDKANYRLNGAALASSAKVEAFGSDGNRVKITVPAVIWATDVLTFGRLSDTSGNLIVALSTSVSAATTPGWGAELPATVTAVAITSKNTIEITITGTMTTVPADGFMTTINGIDYYNLAAVAVSYDEDTNGDPITIVSGTMNASSAFESTTAASNAIIGVADKLRIVANKVKSETGKAMVATNDAHPWSDAFAPSLVSKVQGATIHTFELTFDEAMTVTTTDTAASDLVIVDKDGKTWVAYNDYTVAVSGTKLVVTLTGKSGYNGLITVSSKSAITYIKDVAGNKANAFSGKEITIDQTAPTISGVVLSDANTNGSIDTATVTFSESMSDNSISGFLGGNGTFTLGGQAINGSGTGATANDKTFVFTIPDASIGTGLADLIFTIGGDQNVYRCVWQSVG